MRRILLAGLIVFAAVAAWANPALAGPVSITDPVIQAEATPNELLSNATSIATANLEPGKDRETNRARKITQRLESTILPLFDFRRMTQLATGRNWRLASPEQQMTLIAEFSTLLVRTYSTTLSNRRQQAIEYKPLRTAPGTTEVTVKSTVIGRGAERVTIDYDMEKTPAGWKVYNIKVAGISLITTYQSSFGQTIRDGGVDGLIEFLRGKNRQTDSGSSSHASGARHFLFISAVVPGFFRGGR